jgi:predicted TIM-barrel fold metal-dependent hydrolase
MHLQYPVTGVIRSLVVALALSLCTIANAHTGQQTSQTTSCLFNDSHFHLTNYIQKGTDVHKYLEIMGDKICRSTLFGIPLQQTWSYENSGDYAPTYYLQSDAPLYYYSFTDAFIANAYKKLTPEQQKRIDPMITGFNPADMYAADHIRRVLETYPGVFTGIGEFTIHKEFVSSKVAGDTASLTDPALDKILEFAGEVGLVVILHNDMDMPFAKQGAEPVFLTQMKALLRRHPKTTIIWAHLGLGRVVHPVQGQASPGAAEYSPRFAEIVESILSDPAFDHVYFDISWDEVAKYAISTPETINNTAAAFMRHPDRVLFGTDNVAPPDQATQLRVYGMWAPIWKKLTPEVSRKIRLENYERLFDGARVRVRAWEKKNLN